jgi:hypothetical protein
MYRKPGDIMQLATNGNSRRVKERVVHRVIPTLATAYPQVHAAVSLVSRSGTRRLNVRLNEAKDTGDRATSNRKAEKTLAGVGVSVRRRWLKGNTLVRQP